MSMLPTASHPQIHQFSDAVRLGACPSKALDGAVAGWFIGLMAKVFRAWDVDQGWRLPPSALEFGPPGRLAHFVRDEVRRVSRRGSRWASTEPSWPRGATGGPVAPA